MEALRPLLILGFVLVFVRYLLGPSEPVPVSPYSPKRGPLMLMERLVDDKRIHAGILQNGQVIFQSGQHSDFGSGDSLDDAVSFLGPPEFESVGPPASATWKLPVFGRLDKQHHGYLRLEYGTNREITGLSALSSAPRVNQEILPEEEQLRP